MKQKGVLMIVLVCLTFAGWGTVRAQSGGPSAMLGASYDLAWNTIDGGGGMSSGGAYSLGGAIGQPDAGTLIGGQYTLAGGFWQRETAVSGPYRVYLPLVLRQAP